MGLEGNDTIDGGGGLQDIVVYWWARGPVTVDLTAGSATGEGTDTLAGIEWVGGGDFQRHDHGRREPELHLG